MAGTGLYDAHLIVHPEPDLADLVPVYMERRQRDVIGLEDALLMGDYQTIFMLGHSMKGSGGGYGFDGITEIGGRLEIAGRDSDPDSVRAGIDDLRDRAATRERGPGERLPPRTLGHRRPQVVPVQRGGAL
jgi:HPt (histidine-containing phosphotransfer) domain-containing protein